MAQKAKKVCYYELLGVDRKCEAAEIKSAYRRLALQMHPDKAHLSGLSTEEATRRFQQIQEAYGVLSDPQERAWYDAHREQILRGDDEAGEDPFKTKINLYKYFSAGCYEGFGNGPSGFFAVYMELFEAIDTEEAEWEDADEDHTPMPIFGGPDDDWGKVNSFYRLWGDFCSRKAFGHADKWNPKDAQNRQVRRAMEQENKKLRQAAKKEFNAEVRQLVRFVQKRDPRVAAHQKQQAKESAEKKKTDMAEKEALKAKQAQDKQERKEAMRRAQEEHEAELEANRQARRDRGEVVTEDEESDESEELEEWVCEPCRKTFKSEKAFECHCKSKKHLQAVEKLRRELEAEVLAEAKAAAAVDAAPEDEPESDSSDDDAAAADIGLPSTGGQPQKGKESSEEGSDEDDGDDDDADDFVARLAAVRKAGAGPAAKAAGKAKAKAKAPAQDAEAESDGEEAGSSGSEEDGKGPATAGTGGKRAQKRAKQRELLLARKAEKENVQELISSCKKAQRAARKGDEGEDAEKAEEMATTEAFCPPARSGVGGAGSVQGPPSDTTRCQVCGENFGSRTKLFAHIKATGHAALKSVGGAESGGAKGKKKKR